MDDLVYLKRRNMFFGIQGSDPYSGASRLRLGTHPTGSSANLQLKYRDLIDSEAH